MTLETTTGDNNGSTFLYRFLVHPEFRISRHVLLFFALSVISFNLVFIPYQNLVTELKSWMYPIVLYTLLTYAFVAYFNLYYLLPKYLLTNKYGSYVFLLSLSVIGALLAQMFQEYMVYSYWPQVREYTGRPFFSMTMAIDYLSGFLMTTLCMVGGSITVLLRLWMVNNQKVKQLEKEHILSKVEQLKEQVSPALLFKTLNRSGHLALTEPVKASKMLMKLSWLLRYQLYDCNREKVLLSSEITFLTNYLVLEQSASEQFDYVLSSDGEVNRTLVPPLLFIPFVQYVVEQIYGQDISFVSIKVDLEARNNGDILFVCSAPGINLSGEDGLERIKHRLALQYKERYHLEISGGCIRLELKGDEA